MFLLTFVACVQNINNHNHTALFSPNCMYDDSRNLEADPRVGNSTDLNLQYNSFDSRSNYSECNSVGPTSKQYKHTSTISDASSYCCVGTRPAFLNRTKASDPTTRFELVTSAPRFSQQQQEQEHQSSLQVASTNFPSSLLHESAWRVTAARICSILPEPAGTNLVRKKQNNAANEMARWCPHRRKRNAEWGKEGEHIRRGKLPPTQIPKTNPKPASCNKKRRRGKKSQG